MTKHMSKSLWLIPNMKTKQYYRGLYSRVAYAYKLKMTNSSRLKYYNKAVVYGK